MSAEARFTSEKQSLPSALEEKPAQLPDATSTEQTQAIATIRASKYQLVISVSRTFVKTKLIMTEQASVNK